MAQRHRAFLSPAWLDAALLWQPPSARPLFFCARDGDALVGAAALQIVAEPYLRVPARRLRFLTVPDTQFCDLLAAPGAEERVAACLAEWIGATRSGWDLLELGYLAGDGIVARLLPAVLARAGIEAWVEPVDKNPFVPLQSTWDAFLKSRSRSVKKSINLIGNRLARAGTVEIVHVAGSAIDDATLRDTLAAAVDISARSWKQALGVSLDHPGPHAFITRLTQHARARGWLSIWLLRLDGKPIAMEYQLIADDCVYALRSDFDERQTAVSPGSHLNRELLERLFERGGGRYFMGPGTNAYKWRWTDDYDTTYRLRAYSPTWRGRLLAFADRRLRPAWSALKRPRAPATREEDGT